MNNARQKGIHIDKINGSADHLHCLFFLNADMSVAKTLQLLKGESAHWINQLQDGQTRFEWADDYFAISVSELDVAGVRNYIDNQEQHHSKMSHDEELDLLQKREDDAQPDNNLIA